MLLIDNLIHNTTYKNGQWVIAEPMKDPFICRVLYAWYVLTGVARAVRFQ